MSDALRVSLLRLGLGATLLALWQWGSRLPVIGGWPVFDPFIVSTPSQIAFGLVKLWHGKRLATHVVHTLAATGAAIVIGLATGVAVALLLHNLPALRRVLQPFVDFLNTMPRVVIAPFLLIGLGVGIAPRIVMAWTFVFFLVFFNVMYGLSRIREAHRRHLRMLGGGRLAELHALQAPIAFAWTIRAFPHAVAYGFVGVVFQEFVGGNSGIGSLMIYGLNELNAATVMGTVVLLAVMGLALVAAGGWVARRFAPWRRELGV